MRKRRHSPTSTQPTWTRLQLSCCSDNEAALYLSRHMEEPLKSPHPPPIVPPRGDPPPPHYPSRRSSPHAAPMSFCTYCNTPAAVAGPNNARVGPVCCLLRDRPAIRLAGAPLHRRVVPGPRPPLELRVGGDPERLLGAHRDGPRALELPAADAQHCFFASAQRLLTAGRGQGRGVPARPGAVTGGSPD